MLNIILTNNNMFFIVYYLFIIFNIIVLDILLIKIKVYDKKIYYILILKNNLNIFFLIKITIYT